MNTNNSAAQIAQRVAEQYHGKPSGDEAIYQQCDIDELAALIEHTLLQFAGEREAENAELRVLLYVQCTKMRGYHDDGELQDNTAQPFIDFKRDSVESIKSKMTERALASLKAQRPTSINNPEFIRDCGPGGAPEL